MSRFKKGDKVRVVGGYGYHFVPLGAEVTVVSASTTVIQVDYAYQRVMAQHIVPVSKARKKKRLYKDGERVVVVKDLDGSSPETVGRVFTVVGYEKGDEFPYRIKHPAENITYHANVKELRRESATTGVLVSRTMHREVLMYQPGPTFLLDKGENKEMQGEKHMSTIREKIRELARSKDEKNAIKTGFLSEQGNLTDVGRRTLLDYIWEGDEALRAKVFADINAVVEEECGDKKKSKK